MGWFLAILLAACAFGLAVLLLKAPRPVWPALGAALALGIVGYASQASPALPGRPKPPEQTMLRSGNAAMVEARRALQDESGPAGNKWLVVSDGLFRNGEYAAAAAIVLGAVRAEPNNAEAWLALANALVAHADGTLTPASGYAFDRAADADPAHPGPAFFRGLALARGGQLAEARAQWAGLLARSPAGAPWRADLENRLRELDAFLSQMEAARR